MNSTVVAKELNKSVAKKKRVVVSRVEDTAGIFDTHGETRTTKVKETRAIRAGETGTIEVVLTRMIGLGKKRATEF